MLRAGRAGQLRGDRERVLDGGQEALAGAVEQAVERARRDTRALHDPRNRQRLHAVLANELGGRLEDTRTLSRMGASIRNRSVTE